MPETGRLLGRSGLHIGFGNQPTCGGTAKVYYQLHAATLTPVRLPWHSALVMPLLNKNVVLDSSSLLRTLTTSKYQRKQVNEFSERPPAPPAVKTVYVWQAEVAEVEVHPILLHTNLPNKMIYILLQ